MRYLPDLFANNRRWAAECTARDPEFFQKLSAEQAPEYFWIGCADSRVPANEIVGLAPGELFVHRNVANVVAESDTNCLSALQFAVDALGVAHVIVCGHYGCGGVLAALSDEAEGPLDAWLDPIRTVARAHRKELDAMADGNDRWRRMCELNVMAQVRAVCETVTVRGAWKHGQPLAVHGWIYDLTDGLLRDLDVSTAGESEEPV